MKSSMITALVILNVLLMGMLVSKYMKPNVAEAQSKIRANDCLMIPVDFPGARTGAVLVLDTSSGELSAIMTDESKRRMEAMPPIKMADLFDRATGTNPKPTKRN